MIPRTQLNESAQEWGLTERVVETDYVIGWVLWGIANHPLWRRTWAFKGGTCLKQCYIETYRFSEDLDFTIMAVLTEPSRLEARGFKGGQFTAGAEPPFTAKRSPAFTCWFSLVRINPNTTSTRP